jgi:hypothetical protein
VTRPKDVIAAPSRRGDDVRQEAVIDDRRLVAVAGAGHPHQDDLADAALPDLQDEVVGLRYVHRMGTDHDRLAALDERSVPVEPVRRRAGEAAGSSKPGR